MRLSKSILRLRYVTLIVRGELEEASLAERT